MLNTDQNSLPYPRRRAIRYGLKGLAKAAFFLISDLKITGQSNLPKDEPYILVANHFHFADPVAMIVLCDRQVEFVGGFRFPNAPAIVKFIPSIWGYFPVYRGAYSGRALRAAKTVLENKGVLGIFPEGGAWANVLRPPRPGTAFLAQQTGVKIVPMGLVGFEKLFGQIRPKLRINIGKPIGPFPAEVGKRPSREKIDQIGEEIMCNIAALLPESAHGVYAEDSQQRKAAQAIAAYPFDDKAMRGQ